MLKRLIFAAFVAFGAIAPARPAQIVNVEYIHQSIAQKWGIDIPYNPALTNPKVVANMKYLLTTVDVANEMLGAATNYADDEQYATLVVADTVATNTAIDTLIKQQETKFTITTTPDTDIFTFTTSAKGNFTVDWGDGTVETLKRSRNTAQTYSHPYSAASTYKITIEGQATMYNIQGNSAISFKNNENIAEIAGSLGAIFGTIGNGDTMANQPRFQETFSGCTNLTKISSDLFSGITGGYDSMFAYAFYGCENLTEIPTGLFSGLSVPANYMFRSAFEGCTSLTEAPENLFAGISGAAVGMFSSTFRDCISLKTVHTGLFDGVTGGETNLFDSTFDGCSNLGTIPDRLFAGVSNTADMLFYETFKDCSSLGAIPENTFGDISGSLMGQTFYGTFSGCTALAGPSAKSGGQFLYQKWPDATRAEVGGCYVNANGLSDWDNIPANWK